MRVVFEAISLIVFSLVYVVFAIAAIIYLFIHDWNDFTIVVICYVLLLATQFILRRL